MDRDPFLGVSVKVNINSEIGRVGLIVRVGGTGPVRFFSQNHVGERGSLLWFRVEDPGKSRVRCRANMALVRHSRPDSGLGFQTEVLQSMPVAPSSLGSGGMQRLLVLTVLPRIWS